MAELRAKQERAYLDWLQEHEEKITEVQVCSKQSIAIVLRFLTEKFIKSLN